MPQEDKLKREIDQLARLLGKLLVDLTGPKNTLSAEDGLQELRKVLQESTGLSLDELLESDSDSFKKILESKSLTTGHMEQLADILYQLAETSENENGKGLYEKALVLYERLIESGPTYSLDKYYKVQKIKKAL